MNKYEYNYNVLSKKNARWYDVAIMPLASDLAEATGLNATVSGPFGLRAECTIYLSADRGEKKYITITPVFLDAIGGSELALFYDTGEVSNKFAPGTLGDFNRMNNISERLPDTLDEIVALLRAY